MGSRRSHRFEPDAAVSNQTAAELEGEIASQAPDNQRVAMATAGASELPVIIVSGADSPRSRIGRGLESIGGMTAETLQRISTAVGGVMKSPVVLMAKVGGLASPRAAALAAPPGSSLEERVHHLEIQMKSLEERFNSMTVVTELDSSSQLHREKPRIAKSLLQEMETDRTLVNRVQILEDGINKRMEGFEKALSSIQSRLDRIESSRRESVAGFECQESLSCEPKYYDAEQQSDNFDSLETEDQNFWGAHDVPGEAIGGSRTLEKSRVNETSRAAPTTAKHVEPLQETGAGKNDDVLEPQLVSTPVYSKEAFLTQPMKSAAPSNEPAESVHKDNASSLLASSEQPSKSAAPSSEPAESVHRDDASSLPASSEQQLASTLEELHGSFVTEPSAAAASAKFLEIARSVTAEKSTLAHAYSEPQSTSALEEPRESFPEEPSAAVPVAKSEEHAQEDADDKWGTPTFEATQKNFTEEPLEAALDAKIAQELPTQGFVIIAFPSSEPSATSKSVEAPSVAVPSANSEEPEKEDTGDKSVTMTAARESPKEDFAKESLTSAPGTGPAHGPSSQEDSGKNSDTAHALPSSVSPVASKSIEEPSTAHPGADFEEPAEEDVAGKSDDTTAVAELPSAPSSEEPHEESVKEFMAVASNAESPQVMETQEDDDMKAASRESQIGSKFVEEPSAIAPSADFEEPAQEDVADKTGTTMAATESSLASSLEEPKEGFEKESMASAPSGEPAQEHSDMAITSSETEGALATTPSANFGEREHKADADESGTLSASAESPLASFDEPQEDFEEESSATAPSAELIQELATQEDSSLAFSPPETTVKSQFAEDSSTGVESAGSEGPVHEDVDKGVTTTTAADSPLPIPHHDPQEDFEKESSAAAPSTEPIHEPSSREDSGATSDKALASSEPRVASKFAEVSSTGIESVGSEDPAHEDADKGVTSTTATDSPLPIPHQDPEEDIEKDSLAEPITEPIHEPSSREDLGATSDKALASSEPQVASKFAEDSLTGIESVGSEEPAHEDVHKGVSTTTATDSPLPSPHQDSQEDFESESSAAAPSTEPIHEPSSREDLGTTSDKALASSEPQVASKFVEEPSSNISNVNSEESTQEDGAVKSDTVIADAKSPSVSSSEEPHEEKEPMAAVPGTEPAQELATKEDSDTGTEPAQELATKEGSDAGTEPAQELATKEGSDAGTDPPQELATKEDSDVAPFEPQVTSKFVEESSAIDVPSAKFEERALENSGSEITAKESPSVSPSEAHKEDDTKESLAAGASAKVLEPAEEDESGESPIAFAPLESPSRSFFGISQEASSKEPSEASVQPKELAQESSGVVLPSADSTLTSTMEEDNRAAKEAEYKSTEDFKVHPQHTKSNEKEFPRSQSNLAHVSSEESFATEDSDDHLESDQSDEKFFDVEDDSGNFESSSEFDEPGEATGVNAVAEKETLEPASSMESEQAPVREPAQELEQAPAREPEQEHDQAPAREPEQEPDQAPATELKQGPDQVPGQEFEQDHDSVKHAHAQEHEQQPAQEPEQEDLARNSALALPPSGSQVTSKSGESQELPAEEPLAATPSTKFEEPRQANAIDESATHDLPLTSTTEEPKIDSAVSLEKSLSNGNPELSENLQELESSDKPGTSSTPQETLERESLTAAPSTEVAQGHDDAGRSGNVHKLLEPQSEESKEALANESVKAAPSSESTEPPDGFMKEPSADAESTSKSADLEDSLKEEPQNGSVSSSAKGKHVKIIAEPTEEIPNTQSELDPEEAGDSIKLESQGSFLAFGAESKEALAKEPWPSAKLLQLFEEENNSGERGAVLADSPMTSTVEEPPKPPAEEPLASAKSVPKPGHHFRRRGFARSSSEPQFAYKLEEHRKALAKESSAAAAIPSASKLGEEHAQADFGDTQCLPFRILGEGKHPRKESESKLVEDVKSPATKSETASSPYVLEPRPSKIKLKKKKEKKEKKPDAAAEEKERRLSLGSGEMERKSSLRAEEKDSKYSPRAAEEKHKLPFRHLRDRLRHAFSVNKEP